MAAIWQVCVGRPETRDPRDDPEAPFRYVDISGVDNQRKVITSARQMLGREAPSRARQVIRTNDVLVATTRPNLNAVALVPAQLHNAVCSTGFCVLRSSGDVDPEYLFAFVRTPAFVRKLSDLVKGALYPAVTDGQVRAQTLPLAPVAEQRSITARLIERLGEVAKAHTAVQAQLSAAEALTSAALHATFEIPKAFPFQQRKLGDLVEVLQNGIYKPAEHYGHGWPFVRMYNVLERTWTLNLERLALVDVNKREQEAFALHKGDLLVSRVNSFEMVGKCAWVGPEAEGHLFENMLIRVRLRKETDSLFVAQRMASRPVREQIQRLAKRAIGQASINSEDLRSLQIGLPPLAEQRTLSRRLAEVHALARGLIEPFAARLAALDQLPTALLRDAFTGRL